MLVVVVGIKSPRIGKLKRMFSTASLLVAGRFQVSEPQLHAVGVGAQRTCLTEERLTAHRQVADRAE